MTAEHDALRDLLAPVALGAAEPHEVERVQKHAAECAVCREELASLRAGADLLALSVPQHEPSASLKADLMRTVRAEAPARAAAAGIEPTPTRASARARPRRSWLPSWSGRTWSAAAGLAAIALLLAWNISLQTGSEGPVDRGVETIAVAGTPDAPQITGRLVYLPDEDTAVLRLSDLPALEPGDAYQLWVLRQGQPPRSAGLFEPGGPAEAQSVAVGLAGADGLAVTAQPADSRTTPEGPILVQAPLPSA